MLPIAQPPVVERIEQQLARKPQQVKCSAAVFGQKRTGRSEVFSSHNLDSFSFAIGRTAMLVCESLEGTVKISELFAGVTRLAEFVAAGQRKRGNKVANVRVSVVTQPVGRFHNVRVGIVHHASRAIRHRTYLHGRRTGPTPTGFRLEPGHPSPRGHGPYRATCHS